MIQIGILSFKKDYAQKLAEYLSTHLDSRFEIVQFSSVEVFKKYINQNTLQILIAPQEMEGEIQNSLQGSVNMPELYLSENTCCSGRQIEEDILEAFRDKSLSNILKGSGEIIGVYSPVQRCLKTSISVALGLLCSDTYDKKTLLISLDSFSWLRNLSDELPIADISDLIFTMKNGDGTRCFQDEKLEYIIPPLAADDFHDITGKMLAELVSSIQQQQFYDRIILDIGMTFNELLTILSLCDVIYIPKLQDKGSEMKVKNFEDYVLARGEGSILEHCTYIPLENNWNTDMKSLNRGYFHQLLMGDIGKVLKKGLECFNI
jgi:hypothetical protein